MLEEQSAGALTESPEEALGRREAEIARRELRQGAREALADRGLPLGLLDAIDLSSAEARDASVESVAQAYAKSVQLGVEKRLKAAAPPGRTVRSADYAAMSDEEYYAATYKNKE